MEAKLYRSRAELMIGGVCAGLAHYLRLDVTLVRLFFVLLALANGTGILLYLLLWLIVPYEPAPGAPTVVNPAESGATELAAKARELGTELGNAARAPNQQAGRIVGVALVIVGLLFLLQNLNMPWLWWMNVDYLWPLLLIIGGFALVWRQLKGA